MSKNKKRKVVSLKPVQPSPENYIKTNARSLPIVECLLNPEWEEAGIANILVARKHNSGNITAGIYLVDIYCLGVKDAGYRFNIPPAEYKELKEIFPSWELCEYVLAHNIIYGAIAYAEDYGFKPHKDFSISQFILEEDDENVELMDLEFGVDGKPFYIYGPDDDEEKIKMVANTLKRTAGDGNFDLANEDELEEDGIEEAGLPEDMDQNELVNFFVKEKEANFKSFVSVFKKINRAYDNLVRTPEENAVIKQSPIGKGYKISDADTDGEFDDIELAAEYDRLSHLILDTEDYEKAIAETLNAIKKYPGTPVFYRALQMAYGMNDQIDEAERVVEETYKLYPDYLPARINQGTLLIDRGHLEGFLSVFDSKTDLGYIYPGCKVFNSADAAAYYACMCRYFLAIGDIDSADRYINAIIKKDFIKQFGQLIFDTVVREMCKAKVDKMGSIASKS